MCARITCSKDTHAGSAGNSPGSRAPRRCSAVRWTVFHATANTAATAADAKPASTIDASENAPRTVRRPTMSPEQSRYVRVIEIAPHDKPTVAGFLDPATEIE